MISKAFILLGIAIFGASTAKVEKIYCGGHFTSPTWSNSKRALYWVDNYKGSKIYKLNEGTNQVTSKGVVYGSPNVVYPVKGTTDIIVGVRTSLYLLNFEDAPDPVDRSLKQFSIVEVKSPGHTFENGRVDASGALWVEDVAILNCTSGAATFINATTTSYRYDEQEYPDEFDSLELLRHIQHDTADLAGTKGVPVGDLFETDGGTLYRIKNGLEEPEIKIKPVGVSNGITWSLDNKKMYYIDTFTKGIDSFDFDLESGTIGNRTTIFNLPANNVNGYPHGMTIDSLGKLWVAVYDGGKVIKVDPQSGELLDEYAVNATQVMSVEFGGVFRNKLYVATNKYKLTDEELAKQGDAGCILAIDGTGSFARNEYEFNFPSNNLGYNI